MKKILYFFIVFISMITLISCTESIGSTSNYSEGSSESNGDDVVPSSSQVESSGEIISSSSQTGSSSETISSSSQTGSSGEIISSSSQTGSSGEIISSSSQSESSGGDTPIVTKKSTIYLAGDSTVQKYNENQIIAGWGQYLNLYFDDNVEVVNCARGGRSSRSFINEGRLYDIPNCNYKFSENNGNSIESCIDEGDYLFIQFGHNDDSSKLSNSSHYATLYDRMSPLGTPVNGIYPSTAGTKKPTTHLPQAYIDNVSSTSAALTEIAKYGSEYFSYDSGATYKWYLTQYIDLVRSKGAIPVLVTPVARLKLDANNKLVSGPGLHGDNFAYVEAVRQLAEEQDCLLVDLFAETKTIFETATSTYANYLMSLRTDTVRTWPSGYDEALIEKVDTTEATHFNKYASFLQAAKIAELILSNTTKHNDATEYFKFKENILTTPKAYQNPSNLISKTTISNIEDLFDKVSVKDPNRSYPDASIVVDKISALIAGGDVTNDNYLEFDEKCIEIRNLYYRLNVDDRVNVSNLDDLVGYETKVEEFIIANAPKPTRIIVFDSSSLTTGRITEAFDGGNGFSLAATSDKYLEIKETNATTFVHNTVSYSVTKYLDLRGGATFGAGGARYVSFETAGPCKVTLVARSGADGRVLNVVNSSKAIIGTAEAPLGMTITTIDITSTGTYSIGSAGSGIYLYSIIIEYFD